MRFLLLVCAGQLASGFFVPQRAAIQVRMLYMTSQSRGAPACYSPRGSGGVQLSDTREPNPVHRRVHSLVQQNALYPLRSTVENVDHQNDKPVVRFITSNKNKAREVSKRMPVQAHHQWL